MKHYKGFVYYLVRHLNGDKHWTLKRGEEIIGRYGTEKLLKEAVAELSLK
jgi:transposase